MKEALVVLGVLATVTYMVAQAFFVALQPLFAALGVR